jgi:tetratricopeptide (TPR) repeat protein
MLLAAFKGLTAAMLLALGATLGGCATSAHEMTRSIVQGNDAALRGDYASSIAHYEEALKSVPDSAPARRNLGIVLVKVGDFKRARGLLASVTKSYPADLEVHYFLGEAHRGVQDFTAAAASYQRALRLDARDARAQKALAWTWHKTGLHDRALMLMQPLLKSNPGDLQARLIVASALNKKKRYKEAASTLDIVEKAGFKIKSRDRISAESERALLMTALADANYGLENYNKAALLYGEVLKTRPFLAPALVGAAKCDIRASQNQRAVTKLERAVKADPDAVDAHYLVARLYEKMDANKALFYHKRFLLLTQGRDDFSEAIKVSREVVGKLERRLAGRGNATGKER